MRKIVILLSIAIFMLIGGCATSKIKPSAYGSFAPTIADNQQLVLDAAQQLAALYLPAKTRFDLQQATPDAFGTNLIKALRDKGYAVLEFTAPDQAQAPASPASAATTSPPATPLRYVLDQTDASMYRLTLLVGSQSISRPYLLQADGSLGAAGYWTRKE